MIPAERTPSVPARLDPRLSSTMYLPARADDAPIPLLVAVHGTGREAEAVREAFVPFADEHGVAVLAPLFPADGPGGRDGYKRLDDDGARFDLVLLGMVQDACRDRHLDGERLLMAGFSGGAQVAHRFAFLHPDRLRAAVAAAPGRITLPDGEPWPLGLDGFEARFGHAPDLAALRSVPIGIVVGARDDDAAEVAAFATGERELRTGRTRVERAASLARGLRGLGVQVDLETVPGAGHDLAALTPAMARFLSAHVAP